MSDRTFSVTNPLMKGSDIEAWQHWLSFWVNSRSDDRGVGDRDPRPFVDYARAR